MGFGREQRVGGGLMTAKAFVLIETKVGNSKNVVNKLKELAGVKSTDAVTGPYDVIAVVE